MDFWDFASLLLYNVIVFHTYPRIWRHRCKTQHNHYNMRVIHVHMRLIYVNNKLFMLKCNIFMSTCEMIRLTYKKIMSTCKIIMFTCDSCIYVNMRYIYVNIRDTYLYNYIYTKYWGVAYIKYIFKSFICVDDVLQKYILCTFMYTCCNKG